MARSPLVGVHPPRVRHPRRLRRLDRSFIEYGPEEPDLLAGVEDIEDWVI